MARTKAKARKNAGTRPGGKKRKAPNTFQVPPEAVASLARHGSRCLGNTEPHPKFYCFTGLVAHKLPCPLAPTLAQCDTCHTHEAGKPYVCPDGVDTVSIQCVECFKEAIGRELERISRPEEEEEEPLIK